MTCAHERCWERCDSCVSVSIAFLFLPLLLQVQNPAVTLSDSIRKQFQNFEFFNIDVISSPSLFPRFALFLPNCSCISVCLWTHTIYILCTWDSPEYLAGLSWSTNAEQSKKDFKTVFSLIFLVLVTPNLVKLAILVMVSTFFLLIISLRSFPSNMLALL